MLFFFFFFSFRAFQDYCPFFWPTLRKSCFSPSPLGRVSPFFFSVWPSLPVFSEISPNVAEWSTLFLTGAPPGAVFFFFPPLQRLPRFVPPSREEKRTFSFPVFRNYVMNTFSPFPLCKGTSTLLPFLPVFFFFHD